MKRLFKLVAYLFGGLLSLLIVAVVVVPLMFDPNDHKQRIAAEIESRTGLPVRIEGDISLTLFPWLGATLGAVELGQAPGFDGDTFARTASMQVRVKLLPLLSKQLEMDTVLIDGLQLNLARNAQGGANWEPLVQAATADKDAAAPGEEPLPVAVLAIGGVEISNAAVRWDDALTGESYQLSDLTLSTGELDLSRPIPVALAFDIAGGEPAVAGRVTLDAGVLFNQEQETLRAEGLVLNGDFSRTGALGGAGKLSLTGDVAVDTQAGTLAVAGLGLDADMADVAALGGGAKLELRGDLAASAEAQAASLTDMSLQADLAHVAALGGPARITLGGALRADGGGQRLRIDAMALDADLTGSAIPGGTARLVASGDLSADLAAGRVRIAGLESELSQLALLGASVGLALSGDFDGDLGAQVFDLSGAHFNGALAGYPAADSRIPFDGRTGLRIDLGQQRFVLSDLALDVKDFSTPSLGGTLTLATSVQGDYGSGRYAASRLELGGRLAGGALGGDLQFTLGTGFDADLASGAVALPGLSASGSMTGEQIPDGSQPFELSANINANLRGQRLDIERMNATVGPMKASGDLAVTELLTGARYRGQLTLARFNPRTLLQMFNQPLPVTADPEAFTTAELSAGVSGHLAGITLDPLDLVLDGQRARGSVQVTDFQQPAYRFDLAVDNLDADRYLPPQQAGSGQAATPGAAAGAAAGLPAETLRALDAEGQLRVGRLRISNLTLNDIVVTLSANDGLVRLSPLGAQLYGGSYRGNVALDARGEQTRVTVDEQLEAVQIGPLLMDLKRLDTLSGRADVRLRAEATGSDMDAIVSTLNGNAEFRLLDGEFRGIDIAGRLCGLISGGLTSLGSGGFQSGEGGSTRFSDLTGTATINNGVVVNPDLLARSPLLRIEGRGQANLVTEQLDYTATANLVASCQGQGGLDIAELSRIAVPVRVTGSFSQPKYGIDTAALVRSFAESGLRQQLQDRLRGALPQQPAQGDATQGQQQPADPKQQVIDSLIKGLFGN